MSAITIIILLIPLLIIIGFYLLRKNLYVLFPPKCNITIIMAEIKTYDFRRYIMVERLVYLFTLILLTLAMVGLIFQKYQGKAGGLLLYLTIFLTIPLAAYTANFAMRLMYRILSGRSDHHLLEYASRILNPDDLAVKFDIIKFDRIYAITSLILLTILIMHLLF